MQNGEGRLVEVYYDSGRAGGLIHCPEALLPAPGQYVMAAPVSPTAIYSVLPLALYSAGRAEGGFLVAQFLPEGWTPGTHLALRGPLGHGFNLPAEARRVALIAWDGQPAHLLGLFPQILSQGAEVTLACNSSPLDLPEEIEIQPLAAIEEICGWTDFLAIEAERDSLTDIRQVLGKGRGIEAQVLVRIPMPCGALAECGVCAVRVRRGWKLACKDGPVFGLRELGD